VLFLRARLVVVEIYDIVCRTSYGIGCHMCRPFLMRQKRLLVIEPIIK